MTTESGSRFTKIPAPRPTETSRPFWEGCARHELLVQRCRQCGTLNFNPRDYCKQCYAADLEWVRSSGKGSIYSYTVVWRPQTPAFETPYAVAIVDMDDGYQMLSNVVECPVEEIHVGMLVEVTFEQLDEQITLPKFRPRPA